MVEFHEPEVLDVGAGGIFVGGTRGPDTTPQFEAVQVTGVKTPDDVGPEEEGEVSTGGEGTGAGFGDGIGTQPEAGHGVVGVEGDVELGVLVEPVPTGEIVRTGTTSVGNMTLATIAVPFDSGWPD